MRWGFHPLHPFCIVYVEVNPSQPIFSFSSPVLGLWAIFILWGVRHDLTDNTKWGLWHFYLLIFLILFYIIFLWLLSDNTLLQTENLTFASHFFHHSVLGFLTWSPNSDILKDMFSLYIGVRTLHYCTVDFSFIIIARENWILRAHNRLLFGSTKPLPLNG